MPANMYINFFELHLAAPPPPPPPPPNTYKWPVGLPRLPVPTIIERPFQVVDASFCKMHVIESRPHAGLRHQGWAIRLSASHTINPRRPLQVP